MSELPTELLRPHPERLDPADPGYDEILAAHQAAVAQGQLRYRDPHTGLWVMTAVKHWRRGFCCEVGCRHCPYLPR
jgi:Family of unknown function (DUF5522)